MKALITGASSGIGRDLARVLSDKYDSFVLVGRNRERLEQVETELKNNGKEVWIEILDVTDFDKLHELASKYPDIDLLVNNAGFGDMGPFEETSLDKELSMIDTNIKALHVLTKLYYQIMVKNNHGHILNVASIAGVMAGPLMATYYATKNYVVKLSEGLREELRRKKSAVMISILCPGPVKTGFESAANITFDFKGIDSMKVAKYTVKHLNRFYIVPDFKIRVLRVLAKVFPVRTVSKVIYKVKNKPKEK